MLDAWVIDELRRREERERDARRPALELPEYEPRDRDEVRREPEAPPSEDRGVAIIIL